MSNCNHTRTYAVDTHDRIDCLDCDASWEGKHIVAMEEKLRLAEEALEEMLTSHFNLYKSVFGENADPENDLVRLKARAALEKIRGEK